MVWKKTKSFDNWNQKSLIEVGVDSDGDIGFSDGKYSIIIHREELTRLVSHLRDMLPHKESPDAK